MVKLCNVNKFDKVEKVGKADKIEATQHLALLSKPRIRESFQIPKKRR